MKQAELEKVYDELPIYEAVFELIKLPKWAHDLRVGDNLVLFEMRYGRNDKKVTTFTHVRSSYMYRLSPSYVRFVHYAKVNG